jgi:hypothetical protein
MTSRRIGLALLSTVWIAYLAATILGAAMQSPLDRDESMYVSAAMLLPGFELYREVPFLQMPYFPWALTSFLPEAGTSYLLLYARLFNATTCCACLALLVVIARRIGAGFWTGIALATVLAMQPAFLFIAGQATNHALPLACFLLGSLALIHAARNSGSHWIVVLAGVCMGCAIGVRLTWLLVVAGVPVAIMVDPRFRDARSVMSFALGVGLALVPAGISMLRAPDAFVFQNLGYHAVNREWAVGTAGFDTQRGAFFSWLSDLLRSQYGHALMLAAFGPLIGQLVDRRWNAARWIALFTMVAAAVLSTIAPSPWWQQHAVVFLGVVTLTSVLLCSGLRRLRRANAIVIFMAAALVLTAHFERDVRRLGALLDPGGWMPVRLHDEASILGEVDLGTGVQTLLPLVALEAGLPIELGTVPGAFVVRSRRLLEPNQRLAARGASRTLDIDSGVQAFLSGVEPEDEESVESRLRDAGFTIAKHTESGWKLWVRSQTQDQLK